MSMRKETSTCPTILAAWIVDRIETHLSYEMGIDETDRNSEKQYPSR
jgi:hypothetical protein